jgi:DNA-binding MarR family transcriptional regulator
MADLETRAAALKKNMDVISSYFQSLMTASSSEELSLQELKVIDFIGQRESPIMREVSEYMQVAVSTMTGIIDKLENKGLVKRERNNEDRRIIQVVLTNKGRKLVESYVENYMELSRRMLLALNDSEQAQYLDLTRKIAECAGHYIASSAEGK